MANEFIIKKGQSDRLFQLSQEQLIENCWYLTLDTAEVYVALRQGTGLLELRKLNECDIDQDFDFDSFEERLSALENEDKLHTFGYRSVFPETGINGHLYVAIDEGKTYVFCDDQYIVVGEANDENIAPDMIFGGTADA
jgi:hypothetical protein